MARNLNRIVMHHSATVEGNVERFDKEHRLKKLGGIAYHIVICNGKGGDDGQVERGRSDDVKGAGVRANNAGSLHVCLVGNFHAPELHCTGKPTKKQMNSLGVQLFTWKGEYGNLQLTDHRTDALKEYPTACPGSYFPTPAVKEWYRTCTNKTAMPLDEFLERGGYWDDEKDEGGPVNAKLIRVEFTKSGVEGKPSVHGLLIEGATYVPLREVALAVGWTPPMPVKNSDGETWVRQIYGWDDDD